MFLACLTVAEQDAPSVGAFGLSLGGFTTANFASLAEGLVFKGKLFYHDHEDNYDSYPDLGYSDRLSRSTFSASPRLRARTWCGRSRSALPSNS